MKKSLRKSARTVLVVLAIVAIGLIIILIATTARAEWKWQHFGADPFAKTRAEAMQKRANAFLAMEIPPAVIIEMMIATESPGEPAKIANSDKFVAQVAGRNTVHRDVVVAWIGKLPRGMELAAAAEKWSATLDGKIYSIFLPEVCFNWSLAITSAPPVVTEVATTIVPTTTTKTIPPIIASCPDIYTLKVNVWQHGAIALNGVERTHAKEELAKKEIEERFVGVPHVSRTHGGQFRKAYANGDLRRSTTAHNFRVSLIMTPESQGGASIITSEQIVDDITVIGLSELTFTRGQLEQWDAIRLVPIKNSGILSPPRSGITGLHELRFFNHLPGKKLGEWENNPVPDCIMNEHWIEEE